MDDFIHTENFILIDQNGRIRAIYNITYLETSRMIEDIKSLFINYEVHNLKKD